MSDIARYLDECDAIGWLPLDITPMAIAAAKLEYHRRIAIRSGSDPAVVDSPAYRATLARHCPPDVAAHILRAHPARGDRSE